MSTTRDTPPFIDLNAPEIMISGFHRIDNLSGRIQRYVCYAENFAADGTSERRHVLDILISSEDVPGCIQQAVASLVVLGVKMLVRPPALMPH